MTTHKDTLLELATRCEQATGPDRELDRCLFAVLHGVERERVTGPMDFSPTASLDAAMTLVPEGWDWSAQTSRRKDKARASCDLTQKAPFKPDDWKLTTARAATPALALCAASLRARAAQ